MNPLQMNCKYLRHGRVDCNSTYFTSLLRWFTLNSLACQGPQVQHLSEALAFPRQNFCKLLTWVGSRLTVAITLLLPSISVSIV